jgi:hypothetical protein
MNDKIKKLYELAKRGIGGEKANAEKILARMLKDSGLTMANLEREEYPVKRRELKYGRRADFKKLMLQILFCVLNLNKINVYLPKRRNIIAIDLTDIQYAEVMLRWNIYKPAYEKEKELLLNAFFCKHNIDTTIPSETPSKLTEAEADAILRKAAGMNDIIIPRRLNGRLLEGGK